MHVQSKFKIFVYANSQNAFLLKQRDLETLGFTKSLTTWCDSNQNTRLETILMNPKQWLLFLDADCEPLDETFKVIDRITYAELATVDQIHVGVYLNPVKATYLQQVHNFVANRWVAQSFEPFSLSKHILGGIFIVYHNGVNQNVSKLSSPIFWGAEDLWLSQALSKNGFSIEFNQDLKVVHHTSSSLLHFVKRAWLQGINHQRYITEIPSVGIRTKYSYWLRQILSKDIVLAPLILLHFCIQKLAILFQKIRPEHS